jgi:tetratricopeptide (TPR) repeat protein
MSEPREHEQYYGEGHLEVFEEFYQLSELFEYEQLGKEELAAMRLRLRELIKKQPDYLDPYLLLCEVYAAEQRYLQASKVLDKAYRRALSLILDKEGNWPDLLPWVHLDNRPIVRTFLEMARQLWHRAPINSECRDLALSLYKNLLRTNPNDNPGVRYLLLAMLEGMSPQEFDDRFSTWNELAGVVSNNEDQPWFEANAPKHAELKWWLDFDKTNPW